VPATLEFDTEGVLKINAIELEEATEQTGHVRGYRVEGFVDGVWTLLAEGDQIGPKKIQRFGEVKLWKIRLTIIMTDGYPAIPKIRDLPCEKVGVRSQELARTRRSQETIVGQNSESRILEIDPQCLVCVYFFASSAPFRG